jgi:hypothetical protein
LQQFADFLVVVDEENRFTDYAHGVLLVVMGVLDGLIGGKPPPTL